MTQAERNSYNREYWLKRKNNPFFAQKRKCNFRKWYEHHKSDADYLAKRRAYMRKYNRAHQKQQRPDWIAIMNEWNEFHVLPYHILMQLNNEEHLEYCRRWMAEHPGLANGMSWEEFRLQYKQTSENEKRRKKK